MQDDTLFVLFHGVDDFVTEYMFRPEGAPRNITNTELGLFEYENNLGQVSTPSLGRLSWMRQKLIIIR